MVSIALRAAIEWDVPGRRFREREQYTRPAGRPVGRESRGSGEPAGSGKRVRALVFGRVQGVFFRDTTRREASALGVRGMVRNRADGSVEVVVEGEPQAVAALVAFLHRGPPRARVDRVELREEPFAGEFDRFSVL